MGNSLDNKEIYRLWWKYLRQSEDYKKLCLWERNRREAKSDLAFPSFRKKDGKDRTPYLLSTYYRCGNVHDITFSQWWERIQSKLAHAKTHGVKGRKAVEEFSTAAGSHILQCAVDFSKKHHRDPSLAELAYYFPLWLQDGEIFRGYLYLMISVAGMQTKDLVLDVKKIIAQKRREDPYVNAYEKKIRRDLIPTANKRPDELRRYLTIYDAHKKGLTIPQIIKKHYVNQSSKSDSDSVRRACSMDIEKAKRIIENVEQGVFPGYYERNNVKPGRIKLA